MPRNAQHPNDLRDQVEERADEGDDAGTPSPLPVTVPAADPALGWAGWTAEGILPWPDPPAEFGRAEEDEGDGTVRGREPRQR